MFFAVCTALVATGLTLLTYGGARFLRDRRLGTTAAGWTVVEGEIVFASLDVRESAGADQERLITYRPVILYRYPAPDGDYKASRVWLHRAAFDDEVAARAWLEAHEAGDRVTVHFDPARPETATLIIDEPSKVVAIVTVGLGVMLAWAGLSLLVSD